MKINRIFGVILSLSLTGVGHADLLTLGSAADFNVFSLGNFSGTGTDAQGRVAVGGNFAPSGGSFTVGSSLNDPAGIYDLIVGGNYNNTYTSMNSGDIYVGGNMSWTDPTIGHNAYVGKNFSNTSNGGSVAGTIYYGGTYSSGLALNHSKLSGPVASPVDFTEAAAGLDAVSTALAADAATGTVTHSYSTYTLTGTKSDLNVFNLADTSYQGTTINITAPTGSTVVINVAGSAVSFTYGSINLNGVSANNVIWNFDAATALSLNGIGFMGSILAPDAAFSGTYGNINGQLIADSVSGTTEFHNYLFSGNLGTSTQSGISATPEPGSWILLTIGSSLLAIGVHRRRQKLTAIPIAR